MNATEHAINRAVELLQKEIGKLRLRIESNKWDMKRLVEEQTILKREKAILCNHVTDFKKLLEK